MSDTTSGRHSETFPDGYGDFTIESSDGMLFHIPSFLLGYASPIFKDMLDVVSERSEKKVTVTEDSVTLNLLFRHIDPKRVPLPLHEDTVTNLLEAGQKYQIPEILDWFKNEVDTGKAKGLPHKLTESESLLHRNPRLVLSLAIKYGIKSLIEPAILLRVGQGPIEESDRQYGFDIYHQICVNRQERIQLYLEAICDIGKVPMRRRTTPRGSVVYITDLQPICTYCGQQYHRWVTDMMQAIEKNPRWDVFDRAARAKSETCLTDSTCAKWLAEANPWVEGLKEIMTRKESEITN